MKSNLASFFYGEFGVRLIIFNVKHIKLIDDILFRVSVYRFEVIIYLFFCHSRESGNPESMDAR